jgi:hypothetical protein
MGDGHGHGHGRHSHALESEGNSGGGHSGPNSSGDEGYLYVYPTLLLSGGLQCAERLLLALPRF